MSSKKRSSKGKKTPQKQRKSMRNKRRSEKGLYYDQHVLHELDETSPDIITKSVEKAVVEKNLETQSTPAAIIVNTPRRKSVSQTQEVDLETEVADTVNEMMDEITDPNENFPRSVVSVNTDIVKEIHFELESNDNDMMLLANIYELNKLSYEFPNQIANPEESVTDQNIGKVDTELELLSKEEEIKRLESKCQKLSKQVIQEERKSDEFSKVVFHKSEENKVLRERVKQLENNNQYRNEVIRLEGMLNKYEREIKDLKESNLGSKESLESKEIIILNLQEKVNKQDEELKDQTVTISDLEEKAKTGDENVEFFMDENTRLRNKIKLLKPRNEGSGSDSYDYVNSRTDTDDDDSDTSYSEEENQVDELKREIESFKNNIYDELASIKELITGKVASESGVVIEDEEIEEAEVVEEGQLVIEEEEMEEGVEAVEEEGELHEKMADIQEGTGTEENKEEE